MKTPFRLFSAFVLVTLFTWLMPLGAFINASQEKTACDGQRPFHMCSMMKGKAAPSDGAVKITYSNPGSAEKTAKSSASGGDDFTASPTSLQKDGLPGVQEPPIFFFRPSLHPSVPTPPPKISLLF